MHLKDVLVFFVETIKFKHLKQLHTVHYVVAIHLMTFWPSCIRRTIIHKYLSYDKLLLYKTYGKYFACIEVASKLCSKKLSYIYGREYDMAYIYAYACRYIFMPEEMFPSL